MDNKDILKNTNNLYNLLNNNNSNNINTKNSEEIEKVLKIANSIKSLTKNTNEKSKKENPNVSNISLENPNIKTIKSVLPFLDLEHKKNIGVFIEMMEVNHILNEYKVMKVRDDIEKNKLKKDAIVAIKAHLKESNKDFIDLIIKFLEINEITNKINSRKE